LTECGRRTACQPRSSVLPAVVLAPKALIVAVEAKRQTPRGDASLVRGGRAALRPATRRSTSASSTTRSRTPWKRGCRLVVAPVVLPAFLVPQLDVLDRRAPATSVLPEELLAQRAHQLRQHDEARRCRTTNPSSIRLEPGGTPKRFTSKLMPMPGSTGSWNRRQGTGTRLRRGRCRGWAGRCRTIRAVIRKYPLTAFNDVRQPPPGPKSVEPGQLGCDDVPDHRALRARWAGVPRHERPTRPRRCSPPLLRGQARTSPCRPPGYLRSRVHGRVGPGAGATVIVKVTLSAPAHGRGAFRGSRRLRLGQADEVARTSSARVASCRRSAHTGEHRRFAGLLIRRMRRRPGRRSPGARRPPRPRRPGGSRWTPKSTPQTFTPPARGRRPPRRRRAFRRVPEA